MSGIIVPIIAICTLALVRNQEMITKEETEAIFASAGIE